MRSYLVIASLLLTTFACKKPKKKDADDFALLTMADLQKTAFKNLDSHAMATIIKGNRSLADFRETTITISESEEELRPCERELLDGMSIKASGNTAEVSLTFDAAYHSCYSKYQVPTQSIEEQADACPKQDGGSASIFSKPGGWLHLKVISDRDLSHLNGMNFFVFLDRLALADLDLGSYTLVHQTKNLNDHIVCQDNEFYRFTTLDVYTSSNSDIPCEMKMEAGEQYIKSCATIYSERLVSIEYGNLDFDAVKEKFDTEHYQIEVQSEVKSRKDQRYPYAGSKKISYRNWSGTISFSSELPTYQLQSDTENLEGSFN